MFTYYSMHQWEPEIFSEVRRWMIQYIQKHFWSDLQKSEVPSVCIAELVVCQHRFKMWYNENHHVQSEFGLVIIYLTMHLKMEKCLLFLKMLTFCCLLLPLITYPQRHQTVKTHWASTGSLSGITAQWKQKQTDTVCPETTQCWLSIIIMLYFKRFS